ncbi:hypothetical protein BH10BAC6_BH10BAC6_05360 [soil metagenome]
MTAIQHSDGKGQAGQWFLAYKPLLLLLVFVSFLSLYAALMDGQIHWMHFMRMFMAGFFLSFSFFKLLDLKGFADSFAMYDVIAKRFKQWGYMYAFIELALGVAFLIDFNSFITNVTAIAVMGMSIVSVVLSIVNKSKCPSACMGAVFKMPMGAVSVIEDGAMVIMSVVMLLIM